ncbi:hypothetical protein YN1551_3166 [Sulfolobus islandicus Y.N.15.51]|uniref:Uncharacterized protein n=2 Tax=Saccharolobus islandicus TaxID=43080 RepID=C3NG83_SACI1|nr:hypothetical protein YN1551_3166 [Sulfolobus islandicus Y.N.15.51]ADX84090.1 hypothetical protein SiH_2754 [Sulfolobus islandicus HVE10/4]
MLNDLKAYTTFLKEIRQKEFKAKMNPSKLFKR